MTRIFQLTGVLLLGLVAIVGCSKDQQADFAKCTKDAYDRIGVHPESTAETTYLEAKSELIGVCMRGEGYKIDADKRWIDYRTAEKMIYKSYGIWTESPDDPRFSRDFALAEEDFKRWQAKNMHASQYWK